MSADAQYGHAGRHHGIGTPECPRDLHHHHDERCEPRRPSVERLEERVVAAWNAGRLGEHRALLAQLHLLDRRQRAREAGYDAPGVVESLVDVEAAIEVATRVRVDDELVNAGRDAANAAGFGWLDLRASRVMVAAAFAAAGFEVEEQGER